MIGPHLWQVVSSPETDHYLSEAGLIGETKSDRLVIRVRSDLPESVWQETLLHEVLHACWSMTSLPETLGDREEEVVRALSPLLAQAVRVQM